MEDGKPTPPSAAGSAETEPSKMELLRGMFQLQLDMAAAAARREDLMTALLERMISVQPAARDEPPPAPAGAEPDAVRMLEMPHLTFQKAATFAERRKAPGKTAPRSTDLSSPCAGCRSIGGSAVGRPVRIGDRSTRAGGANGVVRHSMPSHVTAALWVAPVTRATGGTISPRCVGAPQAKAAGGRARLVPSAAARGRHGAAAA